MVMPSNNTSALVRQLGRLFPGRVGQLIGPGGWREPCEYLPYALDNGAFGAFTKKVEWEPRPFLDLLERAKVARQRPVWVAVPDAVANARATKERWLEWAPRVRAYGFPCAFVVQDGMTREDVPLDADVVFVGGSVGWKWSTLASWCAWFTRVHVGRVNSLRRLIDCEERGVESVDGTGWFRGDEMQGREFVQYVAQTHQRQVGIFEPLPEPEEVEVPGVVCDECGRSIPSAVHTPGTGAARSAR